LQYDFGTAAAQNCQVVKGGQQSVQSNNIDWQQSQYVCMPGDASGKTEQVTILTSTATSYSIDYMTSQENFDNAYQVYFKPMVTSFKLQ
jgi:uncharacterized protein YaiE (UPF0345 family)